MKKSRFFKIYIAAFSVLAILIIIGLIVMWFGLDEYEKCQPANLIDPIVKDLNDGDYDKLLTYCEDIVSPFETADDFKIYLKDNIDNKKISYYNKGSNTNIIEYSLNTDKKEIATIALEPKGKKTFFKNQKYKIKQLSGKFKFTKKAIIIAPKSAKVYLNKKEISKKYIKENDIDFEELNELTAQIRKPKLVKYEVDGLIKDGVITSESENGSKLKITKDKNKYTVLPIGDKKIGQKYTSFITKVAKSYTNFITNDAEFSSIGQYINPNTLIYKAIRSIPVSDYTPHDSTQIKNIKFKDFLQYSENIFSYRVTFDHYVTRDRVNKVFHYNGDYTILFADHNGKCLVYDMIINSKPNEDD